MEGLLLMPKALVADVDADGCVDVDDDVILALDTVMVPLMLRSAAPPMRGFLYCLHWMLRDPMQAKLLTPLMAELMLMSEVAVQMYAMIAAMDLLARLDHYDQETDYPIHVVTNPPDHLRL